MYLHVRASEFLLFCIYLLISRGGDGLFRLLGTIPSPETVDHLHEAGALDPGATGPTKPRLLPLW